MLSGEDAQGCGSTAGLRGIAAPGGIGVIFEGLGERRAKVGDAGNERALIGFGSGGEVRRDCRQVGDDRYCLNMMPGASCLIKHQASSIRSKAPALQ